MPHVMPALLSGAQLSHLQSQARSGARVVRTVDVIQGLNFATKTDGFKSIWCLSKTKQAGGTTINIFTTSHHLNLITKKYLNVLPCYLCHVESSRKEPSQIEFSIPPKKSWTHSVLLPPQTATAEETLGTSQLREAVKCPACIDQEHHRFG